MKSMRKVIPAFALLLVSAVILSTASYAWFTMSRQVSATGMNVTVTAPNNLLISKYDTGDTWEQAKTIKVDDVSLIPASTTDGVKYFVLESGSAADSASGALIEDKSVLVSGDAALSAKENGDTPKSGAYYDFKYRIKTEGDAAVPVILQSLSITDNGSNKSMKPTRVAILSGTSQNPNSTDGTILYSVNGGANQSSGNAIKAVKAASVATDTVRDTVTYKTAVDDATLFTVSAPVTDNENITYVTIRVWYEGEDKECTATLGAKASFKVDAVFSAK